MIFFKKNKAAHNTSSNVEQYYAEWTDKYIESFGSFFQAMLAETEEELIDYLAKILDLQKGQKILDAGCGIGGPAIKLASSYPVDIEGLTLAQVQVDHGKKALEGKQLIGSFSIKKGDFHKLDSYYKANQFDAIYFLESLCHSDKPHQVLETAFKILKPSGRLYIKDLFRGPNDSKLQKEIDYAIQSTEQQFCLSVRPIGQIIDLLGEAGFELKRSGVPGFNSNFDIGNAFTAKHLFKLLSKQEGPWQDEGFVFLNWLEILATKPAHA